MSEHRPPGSRGSRPQWCPPRRRSGWRGSEAPSHPAVLAGCRRRIGQKTGAEILIGRTVPDLAQILLGSIAKRVVAVAADGEGRDTAGQGAPVGGEIHQRPLVSVMRRCRLQLYARARVQLNKLATAGPICTGGQVGHLPPVATSLLGLRRRSGGRKPVHSWVGSAGFLQVRVGIATSIVVVSRSLLGASGGLAAFGEADGLAAKLSGLADPGGILISDGTRRMLGSLFQFRPGQSNEGDNSTSPIAFWEVLGEAAVASRFEALRSGATPLVGRDEEIELLLRRWAVAKPGLPCGVPPAPRRGQCAQHATSVRNSGPTFALRSDRKPPKIFCRSFIIRPSRSARLLVKGTRRSVRKRSTSYLRTPRRNSRL